MQTRLSNDGRYLASKIFHHLKGRGVKISLWTALADCNSHLANQAWVSSQQRKISRNPWKAGQERDFKKRCTFLKKQAWKKTLMQLKAQKLLKIRWMMHRVTTNFLEDQGDDPSFNICRPAFCHGFLLSESPTMELFSLRAHKSLQSTWK